MVSAVNLTHGEKFRSVNMFCTIYCYFVLMVFVTLSCLLCGVDLPQHLLVTSAELVGRWSAATLMSFARGDPVSESHHWATLESTSTHRDYNSGFDASGATSSNVTDQGTRCSRRGAMYHIRTFRFQILQDVVFDCVSFPFRDGG